MIKSIEMHNVKGQSTTQHLTGKDIITGRNGAGKTTRLQSIGLAMLGYVPGKGKTTADTFKLASDDDMAVRMETDTFDFTRRFEKTRKLTADGTTDVKISQKLSVSPNLGESTNTQKEQRIKQEIGDFPVMLDFGAFTSMTDNQQRDFIYNLSGSINSWDRERVEKEIKEALLDPDMADNSPELYECMRKNVEATMMQYREGADVQTGILAMSEHAKEQLKRWKKEKANADGAAKKLTELKNKAKDTDRELNANMEKMKELQEQREQIIKDLANLTAKNKTLEEKAAELAKLREEITKLEDAPDSEKMKELEEEIGKLAVEIADMEAAEPELEQKENKLRNNLASYQAEEKTANENLLGMKEELATINAEIKANSDLLQRIADSHGCCAFSPNIPCNQDFSDFITKTHDIMDDAYDKKDAIEHGINETTATIENLKEKIRWTQAEQNKNDQDKKDHSKSIADKKKLIEYKRAELLEINGREPVLAAKRQQEADISSYLNENPIIDLSAMEDQKTLVTSQTESLAAIIDEQKKVRNDLMNIKANIIDSQTADIMVLSWKQIETALGQKGIKGEITKEILDPLLLDVNTKLHEIGIGENFFFETSSDTGKEIFDFGWGERPFEALSTGEQLLLMTALMTAIIERANPPIKVLAIDNINDLDRHNLSLVMKGLNTIGKKMDNIILAGVVEPTEEDCEGWSVWKL